jgi:hypothetical protein
MKESSAKTTEFIFFGCWNNIDCKKKNTDRDIVLHLIKALYQNYKIILAGDNWYNQKVKIKDTNKQLKYYPLYILQTGYKLLFDISKKVDIVLGNHDINIDNTIQSGNVIDNFCHNLGCMLYVQNNIISQTLNAPSSLNLGIKDLKDLTNHKDIYTYENFKNITLYTCKPKLIRRHKGIYFLYINTNVFETSIETIINYKNLIESELLKKTNIKLLFIVGHHPFAGLKEKNKILSIKPVSELYSEAIYSILDLFAKYKSIYLCADIHNFQVCKLHPNIVMVIAGSAGAKADIVDEKFKGHFKLNDSYSVSNLYAHNSYGFSKISYDKENLNVIVQYYKINTFKHKTISYSVYSYLFENTEESWNIKKVDTTLHKMVILNTTIKLTESYCKLFNVSTGTEEDIIKQLIKEKIIASNNGKHCGIKK